jgi:hypothetical protein
MSPASRRRRLRAALLSQQAARYDDCGIARHVLLNRGTLWINYSTASQSKDETPAKSSFWPAASGPVCWQFTLEVFHEIQRAIRKYLIWFCSHHGGLHRMTVLVNTKLHQNAAL